MYFSEHIRSGSEYSTTAHVLLPHSVKEGLKNHGKQSFVKYCPFSASLGATKIFTIYITNAVLLHIAALLAIS